MWEKNSVRKITLENIKQKPLSVQQLAFNVTN